MLGITVPPNLLVGADEVIVGTASSTMLAGVTLAIYRENAALMSGAKYYFRHL
jgi:hypothetical protein